MICPDTLPCNDDMSVHVNLTLTWPSMSPSNDEMSGHVTNYVSDTSHLCVDVFGHVTDSTLMFPDTLPRLC